LLTLDYLKKIDTEKMFETYDNWPKIAEKSYNKKFLKINVEDIDHIVFAGMGGSGTIGDIFSSILSKSRMHVTVVKGYSLPKTVNEKSLVICTSISGNTQETLSILNESKKSNAKFIGLSSGGIMEEYCNKNNIEHFKIKKDHSPRASLIGFLYSALNILNDTIPIEKKDIDESIRTLNEINKKINSNNLNTKNIALEISMWIKHIPIIYYPVGLESVAIRFKNSMQENAKKHVMCENIIEMCHNGIVSWERKSDVQPILIQGKDDHSKTIQRWQIIKEFFDEKKIECKEIFSAEGNILTKIICLIYLLDTVSIYYSVLSNINPSPVESIDFIKKRL
tara:strand:+ start:1091 stop:2101 length:1011 start_codon:yes stop_codon:yes gene_type:complete